MKKFCVLFFLAAMIFAGCSEKDDAIAENPNPPEETPGQPIPDETPVLAIGTAKYTFPAEGGSVRIQFYVNVDWKISIEYAAGDSGWLTSTLESGEAGNIVLPLTAESNPAAEQRSAAVHILYGGKLCEVFVVQSAGTSDPVLTPVLNVENTDYTVVDKGGFIEVPFEVNVDWEASIKYEAGDSGWLTLTPESGEAGSVVLTLTAEANFATEQRKAFVRILYGERYSTLTIIQSELNENTDIAEAFDPLFAQTLQQRGYIADANYITYREVRNIAQINVYTGHLTSLQGIEFFSALTKLDCSNNYLTALDVSKNTALTQLNCFFNGLNSLDVSGCTALTELSCYGNQLTTLDVSGCTALTELSCYDNQLTTLDVSGCTVLTSLKCRDNQLTTLNVSGCTALKTLDCCNYSPSNNNKLTSLDVSGCTALTQLNCDSNQLVSLCVSTNTALTKLDCFNNQLVALDVSKNTSLTRLSCGGNRLTSLNISTNTALTQLNCFSNQLTSLDVSKNTLLTQLLCSNNSLTSLNVSKNTALTRLDCYNNQLTSLNVSENTSLARLSCGGNRLTSLNISKNTALACLFCSDNPGNGAIFYVTAWFDNNSIPTGVRPGDPALGYQFPSGSWTYNGRTIAISYRNW